VVAAAILRRGKGGEVPGLADSKLLTALARERVYAQVVKRAAAYSVVVIPAADVDRIGLHRANIMGMRRALAGLRVRPGYVLTDGFPVPGLDVPGLAVWKGDRVAGCIAAASVLAKVTRDRMMVEMHETWPQYEFATHKGYVTPEHQAALIEHGPCPEHRRCYVNVRRAADGVVDLTVEVVDNELEIESLGVTV
jgi:ribonuclease HII